MKKALLFILFTFLICNTNAQSKKSKKNNSAKATKIAENITNNVEVQFLNNTIYTYYVENGKKDTLFTEKTSDKITADNFTVKEFETNNKKLLLFTWNEKILKKTAELKEELFVAESQIWDFENKKRLVKNKQKSGSSEQIRYLSKYKDASETIYSKTSEGRNFSLLPNGDFTLSSEKGTDKFVYDSAKNEYKIVVPKSNARKAANRRR